MQLNRGRREEFSLCSTRTGGTICVASPSRKTTIFENITASLTLQHLYFLDDTLRQPERPDTAYKPNWWKGPFTRTKRASGCLASAAPAICRDPPEQGPSFSQCDTCVFPRFTVREQPLQNQWRYCKKSFGRKWSVGGASILGPALSSRGPFALEGALLRQLGSGARPVGWGPRTSSAPVGAGPASILVGGGA